MNDEEENLLCKNTSTLTNLKQYQALAKQFGPEAFVTHVSLSDILNACKYTKETEATDIMLLEQIKMFLRRVHPYLVAGKDRETLNSRAILVDFMVKPQLYESIPEFLQCIVTCFLIGHNESYVESIGSKLGYHAPNHRNATLEHLCQEVIVAWNGPNIPHCDNLVKDTIDHMHGAGRWHFQRTSLSNRLKFYKMSEAVDSLSKTKCNLFLELI